MLEIRNLKKNFGQLEILRGIDLSVEQGDVVAILGPSGSGKTTFLRCINFLERATDGSLTFDGKTFDLKHISKADILRLRKKTAFVFQNYNLFLNKTALQNVTEGLVIGRKMPRAQAEEIGRRMLDKVGMGDRSGYFPSQLSGGQQQRVAIARALVKMPKILLLDEPLSNLDARLRLQTREEIRRIQKETGITTVFVTHDQEEAMSISDRIVVMCAGVVQQTGRPQQVYDDPVNLFVAKFLGTPPINMFRGTVRAETLYLGPDPVLSVPGVPDGDVSVGIRPEGFLPEAEGPLHCRLRNVEVMGRDVSIVAENDALETPTLRAIIQSDISLPEGETVSFRLKPGKVLLFAPDTGARIRSGEARNG